MEINCLHLQWGMVGTEHQNNNNDHHDPCTKKNKQRKECLRKNAQNKHYGGIGTKSDYTLFLMKRSSALPRTCESTWPHIKEFE